MVPANNLKIQIYENTEDLERLRPEWEALVNEFPYSSTFCTWEWLVPWWRAFGQQDRLLLVAARDASSKLVGLAPLALNRQRSLDGELRVLRLLGDGSQDSDNLDFPVHPDWEDDFRQSFFTWLAQSSRYWDICQFRTLPSTSPLGNFLVSHLESVGWPVFVSTSAQTVIELPNRWEEYTKTLSSKERGKIGIRFRKLEKKYRMDIHRCSETELDSALNALFELHAKHWQLRGTPGTLHVPERRQFYQDLAHLLIRRNLLEFWLLVLDGKIVAAQFGLRHRDTVFSLQEGFDPDYFADSVGYVLRSQVLKSLISEGVRKYDFLGGTDESKVRWGAVVNNYINLEFAPPFTRGSIHLNLKNWSLGAKIWLRRQLPMPIWQRLKGLAGRTPDSANNLKQRW
jgi:CelD/BcsL family acetyltransferase involved in cellulose biosynthesis